MPPELAHRDVIQGLTDQLATLYGTSTQAMYMYLDDQHKSCNRGFAELLGYRSPQEWQAVTTSFPTAFVDEGSHADLIAAFQQAIQEGAASAIPVTWKCKNGDTVDTDVILVPMERDGHRVALHFVQPA